MRVHLTRLNGHAKESVAQISQHMISRIGHQLGYIEMGIYSYNSDAEAPEMRDIRIDGIISGVGMNDVVIFQFPSWNGTRFDEAFIHRLKLYHVKLVILLHDYVPVMYPSNAYLQEQILGFLNLADVIIVPSENMYHHLVRNGLTVSKYVVQGIWDHVTDALQYSVNFKKELIFLGDPSRFHFAQDWQEDIPLAIYTHHPPEKIGQAEYRGYLEDNRLIEELSKGGFGLIWHSDDDLDYMKIYSPYKLGAYMAAGIPVVVRRGFSHEQFIQDKGLGYVVDSISEAVTIIEGLETNDYLAMVSRVRDYAPLLRDGFNMQRILTASVAKCFD